MFCRRENLKSYIFPTGVALHASCTIIRWVTGKSSRRKKKGLEEAAAFARVLWRQERISRCDRGWLRSRDVNLVELDWLCWTRDTILSRAFGVIPRPASMNV